ncbi:MAG: 3-phosphoserine/phosphohydroxythreonine transaminase [Dermatophilaceae bacterium]
MTGTSSFASGPTMLPPPVLEQIRADLVDFAGTGLSVLEVPQALPQIVNVYEQAEQDVRDLLEVPGDYQVLFLPAGASTHFSMVPLNVLRGHYAADYLHTGLWSRKAIDEARAHTEVRVIADAAANGFTRVPAYAEIVPTPGAGYLHYTFCDSAQGLEYADPPDSAGAPLVCDATASLFARPLPVQGHALVYASTQKNLGATGMTLVVVHESMLGAPRLGTPLALDYTLQARCRGRFTTPPVFAWYVVGQMLRWISALGGVKVLADQVLHRSRQLYALIDGSGFYRSPVEKSSRSRTSIPFRTAEEHLGELFCNQARAAGMVGLEGHSSVGGLRVGLFAGTPDWAVDQLVEFMSEFERRYG